MVNFLFSACFGGHFCYHSNGKSQTNLRFIHLGHCPNKPIRRTWWKAYFIFWPHRGGQNSLLMHIPLWYSPQNSEYPLYTLPSNCNLFIHKGHYQVNLRFQGGTSFVDLICFCSVLCLLCLCARLFICALWSPAGKGLTSWLSFVVSTVSLSLSHWYPGSGVVLDCIDSWSLHPYLLCVDNTCY